ncbi:MAG: hypothetical protein KDJ37_11035 [Hyphomicrobiaceae bacterium]|nr:hypothetical protein [Hyphomicrobiaceae bacterium]
MMRPWQALAIVSGAIIAVVIAFASISYNATLGTDEPAFVWLPVVTNTTMFAGLALAFDLGMVASVFGFFHWRQSNRIGAALCVALFLIASLFSIHSVRGYIALNITRSLAPAERAADIYQSLKRQLLVEQEHLSRLREKKFDASRRERRVIDADIVALENRIVETRSRLSQTDIGRHVSPLAGLEWFLAVTLWFFNATCWTAWFGHKTSAPAIAADMVVDWLAERDLSQPRHCAELFEDYRAWCASGGREPLTHVRFYARLTELGARKFRDGRKGPMMYVME